IQDQIRMHRAGDTPADDAARKHIDDESHVYESRPGRDVCEIGDPELIRPNGSEQALDQISRIFRLVASDSGSAFATAHNPLQPERSHQSFDGTAGDGDAIPSQLPPNLAGGVDLEDIIVHASDFTRNLGIASKARRFSLRLSLSRFLFVVGRGGDRQLLADRLDTIRGSVLVDKRHHYFGRRSSSAWAKKAAALRRISLARFNSSFSRSSCLRRSRSVLVSPARLPWSRSACRTHWRKDSGVQPILPAIETIAAHCDSCSAWRSKTIRFLIGIMLFADLACLDRQRLNQFANEEARTFIEANHWVARIIWLLIESYEPFHPGDKLGIDPADAPSLLEMRL